jgi:hypothetical protein
MFCDKCNASVQESTNFCHSCGRPFAEQKIVAAPQTNAKARFNHQSWRVNWVAVIAICALLMTIAVISSHSPADVPQTANSLPDETAAKQVNSSENKTLDFTKIALLSKSDAEKILGKPNGKTPYGTTYPWGDVEYEGGRVIAITYRFSTSPRNYTEALRQVGLVPTSAPARTPTGGYEWSKMWGTALICCGYEFEHVIADEQFKSMDVVVKRRLARADLKPFNSLKDNEHLDIAERILNQDTISDVELDSAMKHISAIYEKHPGKGHNLRADELLDRLAPLAIARYHH